MTPEQAAARQEISDVLQKHAHILGPNDDDEHFKSEGPVPEGPWLLGHWVMAMNWTAMTDDGATWSIVISTHGCSRAEQIGLACLAEDTFR